VESPNFIIDGNLRLPGLVRMPPPFGPPDDSAQAIVDAQQDTAPTDSAAKRCGEAGTASHELWRQRVTALSVGTACTLTAALLGWHTGQHRLPAAELDQTPVAAIAQPIASPVPLENLPSERIASMETHEEAAKSEIVTAAAVARAPDIAFNETEVAARVIGAARPALAQLPVKPMRPRALLQADEPAPTPPKLEPTPTLHDDESAAIEIELATADTAPIASGYAAPGTPVRIELQRHTRFTD